MHICMCDPKNILKNIDIFLQFIFLFKLNCIYLYYKEADNYFEKYLRVFLFISNNNSIFVVLEKIINKHFKFKYYE